MKNNKKLLIILLVFVLIALPLTLRYNSWREIDLRNSMPKGKFLSVCILEFGDGRMIYDHLPDGITPEKLQKFEKEFRECIGEARSDAKQSDEANVYIMERRQLRIVTDKGKYMTYLTWTKEYVHFNWLKSVRLREVFRDIGLGEIGTVEVNENTEYFDLKTLDPTYSPPEDIDPNS
jgi:hypothetical protein